MTIPNWQSQPPLLQNADLTWKENNTLISNQFDDIYFSKGLGLEESEYVFLQGNRLKQRWQNLTNDQHFTIVETGFGTGLNFFSASQLWQQKQNSKNKKNHLHYIAIEQFPISCKNMAKIWQPLLQETPLTSDINTIINTTVKLYPPAVSGYHRLLISEDITLTLLFGDAEHMLNELQTTTSPALIEQYNIKVDAWFLDGFAPAKNPTMWSKTLFDLMANLSNTKTTFATFTAAGIVNRGLTDAGFLVKKTKGFGKKRNMLLGKFQKKPANAPVNHYGPQWFVNKPSFTTTPTRNKKIAVIGGGLAGCHSAYQLAKRGFTVDVFEKNNTLAAAASGNSQGVLFHRLSHQNDSLSRFSLTAWLYATRLYQQFFLQGLLKADEGALNGMLQLNEASDLSRYNKLQQHYKNAEWLRFLSPKQATQKAGISIASPAIEFIQGGWLSPPAVCHALTQHSNIIIKPNNNITRLTQNTLNNNRTWQLHTTDTDFSGYYAVVIANSHNANTLQQSKDLPLQRVRGQISQIPITNTNTATLPHCTICHTGYITPPIDNTLSFGASFILNSDNTTTNWQEHQANIEQQLHFLPSLSPLLTPPFDAVNGRAEIRCTTPDYLPIVGPVANHAALENSYSHIRHNAKANSDTPGQWLEGLYLLTGLGSRGLTYGALAADILASQINSEPLPSDRHLIKALSPARFAIKNIIRQQTTPPK